jgi:hypothetical protein
MRYFTCVTEHLLQAEQRVEACLKRRRIIEQLIKERIQLGLQPDDLLTLADLLDENIQLRLYHIQTLARAGKSGYRRPVQLREARHRRASRR